MTIHAQFNSTTRSFILYETDADRTSGLDAAKGIIAVIRGNIEFPVDSTTFTSENFNQDDFINSGNITIDII